MKHAQRESTEANRHFASAHTESAKVLDERTVLERLETDLGDYYRGDPIVGIANGVVIGAVLWVFLLAAVFIAL